MFVEDAQPRSLMIELRQQAHYWRAQHCRAVQREPAAKAEVEQLRQIVRDLQARNAELTQQLETLEARAAWLEQQVFGRKSEQTLEGADRARRKQDGLNASGSSSQRRRRGKQPGDRGHGRKRRDDLPTEEVFHDLSPTERRCPRYGKAFGPFPGTEDSEVIDWEVHLVRHIHRQSRYRPTCNCQAVPGIVAAPVPPKLIPKGVFSVGFRVRILLEKFLFQRPLYRIRQALALEGLSVSQGTLRACP